MKIQGQPIWILFSWFCILSFLVLAAGFGWATVEIMRPHGGETKSPTASTEEVSGSPVPQKDQALLLSLGDSLTRGTGDTTGQGYVGHVRQALKEKTDGSFSAVNLGIKGQTSGQLNRQIRQPRVRQLLKEARWITLTIGGNDLFRTSGRLEKIDEAKARAAKETYRENLSSVLSEIRKQNPEAPVFLFGLYNPFVNLADQKKTSRLVREWNVTMEQTAHRFDKVVVIPTYDLFQLNPDRYLYSDHFHPNEKGYESMAERLLQVMDEEEKEVTADVR